MRGAPHDPVWRRRERRKTKFAKAGAANVAEKFIPGRILGGHIEHGFAHRLAPIGELIAA